MVIHPSKDHGGDTDKPTWLYCNYDILEGLGNERTGPGSKYGKLSLVKTWKANGKTKFCGNKNLKQSQHYPTAFGVAIRNVILKNQAQIYQLGKDNY